MVRLEITGVAHGGHCVARHEGRVVFVRHAVPGEIVAARVEGAATDRFWRAEAQQVLQASPDRVTPSCPLAGPGGCGGCDWQHVDLAAQRRFKAEVVLEQLTRLGRVDLAAVPGLAELVVESVPGDDAGLGWRTRIRYTVDRQGRPGLRRHRSHEVVPVSHCPIAHPALNALGVGDVRWPGVQALDLVVADAGNPQSEQRLVVVDPEPGARLRLPDLRSPAAIAVRTPEGLRPVRGRSWVRERVPSGAMPSGSVSSDSGDRLFRVTGSGFWQVHPGAATALTEAVLQAADPQPGERALDLYSGVGLFTAALAERVGPDGAVLGVESEPRAAADARRNLHDLPQVTLDGGRVEHLLPRLAAQGSWGSTDVVVLDPPRAGAGRAVLEAILATRPRVVVYVACDPAALGRDVAIAAAGGYRLAGVRAFDLFPQTHHVECVATFVPEASGAEVGQP